jgi:acyl carrier protein
MNDLKEEISNLFSKMYSAQIELDKTFQQNGLDSLDAIEFLLEVETKFGVHFDDEIAFKIKTPNDLIDLIGEAINQK